VGGGAKVGSARAAPQERRGGVPVLDLKEEKRIFTKVEVTWTFSTKQSNCYSYFFSALIAHEKNLWPTRSSSIGLSRNLCSLLLLYCVI